MAARGDVALVLGGARSGKSSRAAALAAALPLRPVLIATAEALDDEMRDRIGRHRAERDRRWRTVEEPIDLPESLAMETGPGSVVVVDCLTLWLSNLMTAGYDIGAETDRLGSALEEVRGSVIFVANEVGLGIVPDNPLARAFRDHAGRLNQQVAARAGLVLFMAAGLPMVLKRPDAGPWRDVG